MTVTFTGIGLVGDTGTTEPLAPTVPIGMGVVGETGLTDPSAPSVPIGMGVFGETGTTGPSLLLWTPNGTGLFGPFTTVVVWPGGVLTASAAITQQDTASKTKTLKTVLIAFIWPPLRAEAHSVTQNQPWSIRRLLK